MKEAKSIETIYSKIESWNIKTKVISIQHLNDLENEIEGKHQKGYFDEDFYRKSLTQFRFNKPETMLNAKSIIITAAPQPQVRVAFVWQGKLHPFIIPPTYSYDTDEVVQTGLEEILNPYEYRIANPALPLKFLAVSSGLAQYGRNNITYIEDLGSFYRLKGYFTDLPFRENSWFEPQIMKACTQCRACEKNCPTAAINNDRFLIRAERCLTYLNESEEAFPEWVDASWHNCLVGCMVCQLVCPQNKMFRNWIEGQIVFTEAETELLLKGTPKGGLTAQSVEKLEKVGMSEYLELLPRNLGVLLSK